MIYRTVLAVVLAAALVGVALQPLDTARRDRASATVTEQVERIERAADTLAATDDPTAGAGARRIVSVRVPARHWTNAGVELVAISPGTDDRPASVAWQVRGGRSGSRVLSGPTVRIADGEPLVLRTAGTHRLVLGLDGEPGSPVVTVRRLK